jgi:D-arginine dehydrogenase
MSEAVDVLIVGGGIAGTSLAARVAQKASVALLEAEDNLGMHATGRSAALLVEAYGPPAIRRLTRMSRAFFEAPPQGFTEAPLARRRGGLVYAGPEAGERLAREYELARHSTRVRWLNSAEVSKACPLLRPGVAEAGFLEPDALDLDTNALLQGFARSARRVGVRFLTGAPVRTIERRDDGWHISTPAGEIACSVLVNAAGAWADEIAGLAGVPRLALQPMRRTAATVQVPTEIETLLPALPFVAPADESFYFKPEARSIMVSLSDETPSEPCDAWPDDLDVALALDRFHAATVVPPVRPTATWAGLRTFAPDRNPVIGFDPAASAFFWHAGLGGYGIQTSPALSTISAKLMLGERLEPEEQDVAETLAVARLRGGAAIEPRPGVTQPADLGHIP